jgi:3-oxoacyl-[acyl-carrier protein] reductase
MWVGLDLRWDKEQIRKSVHMGIQRAGGLDWLVLAGGIGAYTDPIVDEQLICEMVQTNYIGPRLVFDTALKAGLMNNPDGARVLYISSRVVENPPQELEDYAASKAAGEIAFRGLGKRFARCGIRTTILQVGWVNTPMTHGIREDYKEKILRAMPIHRWIEPEEVAQVAYLILNGPDAWTADVVRLSGGL